MIPKENRIIPILLRIIIIFGIFIFIYFGNTVLDHFFPDEQQEIFKNFIQKSNVFFIRCFSYIFSQANNIEKEQQLKIVKIWLEQNFQNDLFKYKLLEILSSRKRFPVKQISELSSNKICGNLQGNLKINYTFEFNNTNSENIFEILVKNLKSENLRIAVFYGKIQAENNKINVDLYNFCKLEFRYEKIKEIICENQIFYTIQNSEINIFFELIHSHKFLDNHSKNIIRIEIENFTEICLSEINIY